MAKIALFRVILAIYAYVRAKSRNTRIPGDGRKPHFGHKCPKWGFGAFPRIRVFRPFLASCQTRQNTLCSGGFWPCLHGQNTLCWEGIWVFAHAQITYRRKVLHPSGGRRIHLRADGCAHARVRARTCARTHTHAHTCAHTRARVHTHTHAHTRVCVHLRGGILAVHVHMHIRTNKTMLRQRQRCVVRATYANAQTSSDGQSDSVQTTGGFRMSAEMD